MPPPAPPAAPPQAAATIILAREEAAALQVYLLRRSRTAPFMPGLHVFPGGRVDAADRDADLWSPRIDLQGEAIRRRLGADLPPDAAVAFGVAAVRETFEEAGILLIREQQALGEVRARLDALRTAGALPDGWLSVHAPRHGWTLAISALTRWSRWLTPLGMKRRYDTVFFLARAPGGQTCRPDGRETEDGLWISPAEALARNLGGEVPLSPPTVVTLQELQECADLAGLERRAASRPAEETFAPRLVPLERGAVIVEPWDPEFGQEEIRIRSAGLERSVLPAGEHFSRIWFDGALWRPVAP